MAAGNQEETIARLMDGVTTIEPSATALKAAKRITKAKGPLAVVDAGEIVGVVAARDIVERVIAVGSDPQSVRVESILTPRPVTAKRDEKLDVVEQRVAKRKLDRIVVVTEDKLPVGTISATAILEWRRVS